MEKLGKYNKFLIALAAALMAVLASLLGNNSPITVAAVGLLGALGVYATPNDK